MELGKISSSSLSPWLRACKFIWLYWIGKNCWSNLGKRGEEGLEPKKRMKSMKRLLIPTKNRSFKSITFDRYLANIVCNGQRGRKGEREEVGTEMFWNTL